MARVAWSRLGVDDVEATVAMFLRASGLREVAQPLRAGARRGRTHRVDPMLASRSRRGRVLQFARGRHRCRGVWMTLPPKAELESRLRQIVRHGTGTTRPPWHRRGVRRERVRRPTRRRGMGVPGHSRLFPHSPRTTAFAAQADSSETPWTTRTVVVVRAGVDGPPIAPTRPADLLRRSWPLRRQPCARTTPVPGKCARGPLLRPSLQQRATSQAVANCRYCQGLPCRQRSEPAQATRATVQPPVPMRQREET